MDVGIYTYIYRACGMGGWTSRDCLGVSGQWDALTWMRT